MIEYSKDIILNSNFSLRRNIKGFDFPTTMTNEDSQIIVDKLEEIYPGDVIYLQEMDENTINKLINDMVLSEDVDTKLAQIALIIKDDYIITINDRDHIGINIKDFDMDLKSAYNKAYKIEEMLDQKLDFAFSPEFGYLTSNARNAGAGIEVSLKMFMFGLVESPETYYGFKQGLQTHGMFADRYIPSYYDKYADDVYIVKNFGNYREDMDNYIIEMEKNIDTLVRNERRFRRDYQILNNISDDDIKDKIDISLNNLKSGKLRSLESIITEIYNLKKYNNLGFNTEITNNELDYLIFNLTKNKYKGNRDSAREDFLNSYIKEREWKQTD